jgi:FkbM family methyltransferase
MKKIIKFIVKVFAKNIIKFLGKFSTGRYFLEHLGKKIFNQKKTIIHNDLSLSFFVPNRLNLFRVNTFATKEPETLNWIENFEEKSVFWDIGANIGLYTCYAAKLRNCKVYAFEPSVFNLELLTKNIFLNKISSSVIVVPHALTDKVKESKFNFSLIEWGGALSTFGEDSEHNSKTSKQFFYKTVGLSIDESIDLLKLNQPSYIKIDVDGIEHLILKGGIKTLQKTKSILVEVDNSFENKEKKISEHLTNARFTLSKEHSTYNQIWNKITH